jgi:hypothetical protein
MIKNIIKNWYWIYIINPSINFFQD